MYIVTWMAYHISVFQPLIFKIYEQLSVWIIRTSYLKIYYDSKSEMYIIIANNEI